MKKLLLTSAILLGALVTSYSQFSDSGYKKFKLGMTLKEAQKVQKFKVVENSATVTVDGVKIELSFVDGEELTLWTIRSQDRKATVVGNKTPLIGKTRDQIKKMFGDKVKPMVLEEEVEQYYVYKPTEESQENYMTSCVIEFDDNDKVINVMSGYNP